LFVFCTSALFADQVVLKNGDRLTGSIIKSDAKSLVIKTEFEGEVTVQWEAIQELKSEQQLHIGLPGGKTVVGPVSTSDGKLEVATKTTGTVETPKESVLVMRNDAEQVAWEKSQHPGLLEGWNGGLDLGFGLTRGNSQTKNLAVAFKATRTGLRDKLTLYEGTIYATNDAPGAVPSTTANATKGGIRYDRDFTPRVFGFVNADFMTDALQDLNLRSVFGGGLGYHLIKRERTTLDVLGGANYTRENYVPFTRNFSAAQVGDEFMQKVGKATVITQNLYFFPDLSDSGEYRANFNFGTVTKMTKWLGWQNNFGDIFVTNPPPGKRQNDLIFTTGLNLAFTH
jgi:putative salt-induced outer membrane protein YdiY